MKKHLNSYYFLLGIDILGNTHIIGAGLSGLSASIHSLNKNKVVNLYESSNVAGGRCRSFYEKKLNIEIDNGNHLVFSANTNFYELCKIVNSIDKIKTLPPELAFYDLINNAHWNLDFKEIKMLNLLLGRISLIPKTKLSDYFSLLKFLFVGPKKTVLEIVGNSKIFKTFWEPLTLGIMNTASDLASAKILSNVLKKTIFKGPEFCNIYQPTNNWNETIIQPSLKYLEKKGCNINFKKRLRNIETNNEYASKLFFDNEEINIEKDDLVILAIPPTNLSKFFPNLKLPKEYNCILNVHFKISDDIKKKFNKSIIGFINTKSHWIFIKNNYISVTVSNANHFNDYNSESIAKIIWDEICCYTNEILPISEFQVVKEKKATIIQSPDNFKLISQLNFLPRNLRISGDWTQSDLPCTIEGSILSGKKAANN